MVWFGVVHPPRRAILSLPSEFPQLLMPDVDGSVEESDWELVEDDALRLRDRITEWVEQVRDAIR